MHEEYIIYHTLQQLTISTDFSIILVSVSLAIRYLILHMVKVAVPTWSRDNYCFPVKVGGVEADQVVRNE